MPSRVASARPWWRVCMVLVGLALAQSAYLLGRVLTLLASPRPPAPDLCSALFARSCDGSLSDERFWVLNVPVAGWGVVYYTMQGGLLFLARFIRRPFANDALLAASLLSLGGLGVSLALFVSTWLGRAPMCPLCLSVHTINLLLVVALQCANPQPLAAQLRALRSASRWLLSARTGTSESARWKLVGFASVALLAVVAYQWVYVEAALRRPPPPDRAAIIAAYRAAPRLALPVSGEDPHLGPLDAPVQLVVFESFRCPGCRRLAGKLPRLRARFGDRLLVATKQYPLSTTCNGRLTRDLQPGACELAWAAQAAHRQGQFWPFHDALLATGANVSPENVVATARRLNLDPARFAADRESDSTKRRVAADIGLGNRLEIPGTPAVFLNGRLVRAADAEVLEILVREELERQVAVAPARSRSHENGSAKD